MANAPYSTLSILSGATNNTFTNSTFIVQSNQNAAFDRLQKAASASAFHSYVGRPQPGKCYPNTRVKLLKRLEKWAHRMEPPEETTNSEQDADLRAKPGTDLYIDPGDESARDQDTDSGEETESDLDIYMEDETSVVLDNLPIIWLKGGAGAGKSAVAQTFAERCEDLGHIVASFFFFSTDPTRNNANSLVATLAYQIALADPRIRADMETVIHHDPRMFDKDFTKQFTSLIVNPIQKAMQMVSAEKNPRSCTVIIDGLDECTGGEVQTGIVRAIAESLRIDTPTAHSELPRFLICSRPEEPIMRVFRSADLTGIYTSIDLSTDTTADQDINIFLEGKFAEIKKTHPHAHRIPKDWPSWHDLEMLESNSSGHFIYADTVMKLISADVRPVIALESILGLRASPQRVREPFAELDMLYRHILSRALEKTDIDTIRLVFGFLVMNGSPPINWHLYALEKFLNLQDGELDVLFITIASLAYVQRFQWPNSVKFYHKSCEDFLMDKSRAGQFYIEPDAVHMYAATRCHRMIVDAINLDASTVEFMLTYNIQYAKVYDYVDGKQCHSLDGMTRRRELTAFLLQYRENWQGSRMVVKSLAYYRLLTNVLRDSKASNDLLQRAKGDMLPIIHDFFQSMVDRWSTHSKVSSIRIIETCTRSPHSEMSALAFLLCHPINNNLVYVSQWGTGVLAFSSLCRHLLSSDSHSACPVQGIISLMRELWEDEKMGAHRLTEEKYAEACIFWTMKLTKSANYFPLQDRRILQNQRGIIMNEAARRQRAPFQWRKSRQIIRPYRTKGRSYYLFSEKWLLSNWSEVYGYQRLVLTLTNRELLFGSRPNLVRRMQEQDNTTRHKPEKYIRREHYTDWPFSSYKKAITWHDQRRSVRSNSQPDRRVIRAHTQRGRGEFYTLPQRTFKFSTDYHSHFLEQRVDEFVDVLSRILVMLRKASKSDDLAALRFKAFPLFAQRFPKLMRRMRHAMEQYAVRHGYPAIEGTFGPPMQVPANIQQDAVRVTDTDVAPKTCLFIVQIWLIYLCLRLVALLGGLDEIYTLG